MKWFSFSLLSVLLLSGCTPFKISVSDELRSNHDEYTVEGRQGILIKEKLNFGEYRTTGVKRSWTKGNSSRSGIGWGGTAQYEWVNIISTEYINKRQTVNFSLSDGRNYSEVFCAPVFIPKTCRSGEGKTVSSISGWISRVLVEVPAASIMYRSLSGTRTGHGN
jgi:hypothetical protein